ncbi:MAG: hypothetical protein ACYDCC_09810 [Actinomycetota bacterium]
MQVANPTISETLAGFLAEQEKRLAPSTFHKYQEVIELLKHSLDEYAHQGLSPAERAVWERRYEKNSAVGSFTNSFGPDKILENVGEFLGYFMVRKVWASKDLLKAAGTVTKKLAAWLLERGYATAEEATNAAGRGADAARDLPRADELGSIFRRLIDESPPERVIEEWEETYPTISRIEPGKIWFADGQEVGPVAVPRRASDLAQVGWSVSALLLGRTRTGWRILEIGNVYPS